MKKVFFILVAFLASSLALAQDYSFSVIKSGTGKQAIIFIPGFACSGDVWRETVEVLKEDYTCYVLTMAGFSGVVPEKNPSFESWKMQIAWFIKDKKMEKPILIGHSMGGGLALAIAADFPYLARKIVVVDALPCLMALSNPEFKLVPAKDCSEMINRITAMNEEQFVQMQRMSTASLTTDSSKFDEIVSWGLKSDRETFAKMYCDFSNTDLRERIKSITVPSLILLEPHFRNIETVIKEQYKNLSTVQFAYANKGLHFVMFDDKEWFMNQIREFIKE
ncbi:alpha/beta fold hydrolase [Bacteroides oleiciplenus]|uniref:alpha/beta fold hydrolase n=1 Tax=Bacteroides oleiciplenus TaxID=626931 RepID=UPI0026DB22E3|nr:alpha/beta hydrolase [Bacteroides oleiciplenus]